MIWLSQDLAMAERAVYCKKRSTRKRWNVQNSYKEWCVQGKRIIVREESDMNEASVRSGESCEL